MRLVIEPGLASANYWRDLWRYRELLYFPRLARRRGALQANRRSASLGAHPAGLDHGGVRRASAAASASAPARACPTRCWCLRRSCRGSSSRPRCSDASASLIGNANLITKVYFPRLIVPLAAVVTALVDFLITLGLLAALMVWYGVAPSWQMLLLPVFVLLALRCSSLGLRACCWRR